MAALCEQRTNELAQQREHDAGQRLRRRDVRLGRLVALVLHAVHPGEGDQSYARQYQQDPA